MNRSQLQTVSLLSGCLLFIGATRAQLAVQNNLTPNELVNSILVGQGVTVSNVTFNGQPANTIHDQIGSFAGTSNLGLANGVVLATGQVPEVVGPNMNTSLTVPPAFPVNTPDPDLAFIETMQHCVAVLEFDFIPTGDSISFRFVFGSEEYPEYFCSQFNDLFGFFLSGPGINGPFTNNAVNLGVLPGTQVPVAINTVNSGTPGVLGGGAYVCAASDPDWQSNSIYYVNNPEPNPFNPTTTVELDGFTVPIRARAAVQCGQVYHIKIAIAHAGDSSLDSAVFIEGGSFSSSGSLSVSVATPLNDGTLTEGCGEAIVTVERPSTEGDADIQLTYSGTGITADDLAGSVAQVIIPDGSTNVTFPITAIRDQATEGDELLTINATWTSTCGSTLTDSVSLIIMDYTPMEITAEDLYLQCGTDSVPMSASVFGGLGEVSLDWGNAGLGSPIHVPGLENATYTVTATDQCPESASLEVHVNSGCDIVIPNVITPNADGLNDAWVINGLYRSGSSVKVFNRWGNMVFSSANYANNWRGAGLPDGTYFYEVIDGRTAQRLTGSLTILSNGRR